MKKYFLEESVKVLSLKKEHGWLPFLPFQFFMGTIKDADLWIHLVTNDGCFRVSSLENDLGDVLCLQLLSQIRGFEEMKFKHYKLTKKYFYPLFGSLLPDKMGKPDFNNYLKMPPLPLDELLSLNPNNLWK